VYTAIAGTDMVAGNRAASPPPAQAAPTSGESVAADEAKLRFPAQIKSDRLAASRTRTEQSNATNRLELDRSSATEGPRLPSTNSSSKLSLGEIEFFLGLRYF
jgi:hypothetical protein